MLESMRNGSDERVHNTHRISGRHTQCKYDYILSRNALNVDLTWLVQRNINHTMKSLEMRGMKINIQLSSILNAVPKVEIL